MYYDTIISEVRKDVKAEVMTFNPGWTSRLDLMRLDLVPQCRKKAKKPIKVKAFVGQEMDLDFCVFMCPQVYSVGVCVFVNTRE